MDETGDRTGGAPDAAGLSLEAFRADLEVFSGPLDLLLHLIKRDEVDVLEIPISRITDQYLAALRAMQAFDVNVAAEFLVMAATLMDIKSRMLLPETVGVAEEEVDPRDALVRQLLQYKRFKQLADQLGRIAEARGRRFAREPEGLEPAEPAPVDVDRLLRDVTIWDLVTAYAEVVRQIQLSQPTHIVYSDVPIQAYMNAVLATLAREQGTVDFLDFFLADKSRERFIGIFLALLELVAKGRIVLQQAEGDRAHIGIALAQPSASSEGPPGEAI